MSTPIDQRHAELLAGVDIFANLDRLALAKLAAHIDWVEIADNEEIAREGGPGDTLYVVSSGTFGVYVSTDAGLAEKQVSSLGPGDPFGEMALLTNAPRSATVRAHGPCEVLRLERARFLALLRENPEVALSVAATLSQRLHAAQSGWEAVDAHPRSGVEKPAPAVHKAPAPLRWHLSTTGIVYLASLGILLLGWFVPPPEGLSPGGWRALMTLSAAVPVLAVGAIPDGVLALLIATVWVVGGVVPVAEAFSGFASTSWVLVVSVYLVGSAVASSGLLFRLVLWTLTHTGGGFTGRVLSLGITGLLLGPAAPNATGRISMMAPALNELAEGLGYAPQSRPAAGLAMAALAGFGQMTAITLTSSTTAVLVFAVLPESIRVETSWLGWMLYGAVFNLTVFAGLMATIVVMYRPRVADTRDSDRAFNALALQRVLLGQLSRHEKWSMLVVVLLLLGFASQPLHGIHPAWISVGALAALGVVGVITENTFRMVNWSFIVLFGVLASMATVFTTSGVGTWITGLAAHAAQGTAGNPLLFLLLTTGVCFAITLVLRWQAAAPLATIALAPVASAAGINPVVVGIVAVVACSTFFMPYQSTIYLALYHGTGGNLFTHSQARPVAIAFGLATLLAVIVSVPYWRALGLIY